MYFISKNAKWDVPDVTSQQSSQSRPHTIFNLHYWSWTRTQSCQGKYRLYPIFL